MTKSAKSFGPIGVLILGLGVSAWAVAGGQAETSVVVEKKGASEGPMPVLPPPAIEPTLPPPANPAPQPAVKQPAEPVARQPFMRSAEPKRRVPATTALGIVEEPMPAPEELSAPADEIDVRPAPPIHYDTDGDARRMYRRSGEIELVMVTQNPADHCFYEIPMCIPACCTGEPTISSGRGAFGRGVVEYCWSSGFRAVVKFRHVLGDVRVDYEGD